MQVARAIRDGKTRGAMLPVLYEFPEDIANDTADPVRQKNRNGLQISQLAGLG